MTTIGNIIEDVNPFTEKGAKIVTVAVVPRSIVEDIIDKCREIFQDSHDVAADITLYPEKKGSADTASEIWSFAEKLLSDFENGAKRV